MKCAASWATETPWDVELRVHVFFLRRAFWLWGYRMLKSLMAEAFFSSVNLIASLSFLFRSQPWVSPGLFPSFPGGRVGSHTFRVFSRDVAAFVASLMGQITGTVCKVVAVCASQVMPWLCLFLSRVSWCSGRTQWLWFISYKACVVSLQRLFYSSQSILRVQVCP